MVITSSQIRSDLRQFDPSIFNRSISKTDQLRDTEYAGLSLAEFEERFQWARQFMAEFFEVPIEALFALWRKLVHDCDNFATFGQSILKAKYAKDHQEPEAREPAMFEVAGVWNWTENHSYNIAFLKEGIFFADFASGVIKNINEFKPQINGFGG